MAMRRPATPSRTPRARAITGSSGDRGRRCMRPGVGASKPSPMASRTSTAKLIQRICSGRSGRAVRDREDPRTDEREDEAGQHDHLDPDVLHQVVVEPPTALDRGHDRGEVVVGQDHLRGVLGDLRAGDAHGHADVRTRERRRVVHAVAGHRDDVALLLEDADQPHLVLGRDAGDDADVVDLRVELVVRERGELGAGERTTVDAELAGDGRRGGGVVARDHADADARVLAQRDGVLGFLAGRVDDADKGEQLEVADQRQQVSGSIERGGIEVAPSDGQHPEALAGHPIVLRHDPIGVSAGQRESRSILAEVVRGPRQQHVGRALHEAPHDPPAAVLHLVEGRHQLVLRIERHLGDAGIRSPGLLDVEPGFRGQDDERPLGRVADAGTVTNHRIVRERHRERERFELDCRCSPRRAGCDPSSNTPRRRR